MAAKQILDKGITRTIGTGAETKMKEPSTNALKTEVWKLKAPRKMKHFFWQALSGYVAAASTLTERHCGSDPVCQ